MAAGSLGRRDGDEWLVKVQRKDGAWASSGQGTDSLFAPIPDTCFGLLFLIRGRAPVVMSKLQYAGNWNERPRDLANLVQWMSKQTERHLNWQIVNLQAPVHELHDAPILCVPCVPCVPEEGSERRRTLANGPRNARRRSVVRDAPSAPSGDADSFGVR